jgi:hypothetical protein
MVGTHVQTPAPLDVDDAFDEELLPLVVERPLLVVERLLLDDLED